MMDSENYLKERLAYLTEEKGRLMEGMELISSITRILPGMDHLDSPRRILQETSVRIGRMVRLKASAFFLIDENTGDFRREYCSPQPWADFIEQEIDLLIRDRTVNWAINHHKPTVVHASDEKTEIMLHPMIGSIKIRGLYVGILGQGRYEIPDACVFMVTGILQAASSTLEGFDMLKKTAAFNRQLQEKVKELETAREKIEYQRRELEKRVEERTRQLALANSRLVKEANEREQLIGELTQALAEIETLSGLIPICANCKKIRDDKGFWTQVEQFIEDHSKARFSHSICPKCAKELYPEFHKE